MDTDFGLTTLIRAIHVFPLAQLLRPSPKSDGLLRLIGSRCGNGESAGEPLARYLEYPVWPRHPRSGRPFAQPSMSDAMLLGDHVRIAVEGKWTEPHYGPYQTIWEWLDDRQPGAPTQKPAVLAAWLADIRAAGALRRGVTMDAIKTIPYQLVHRAASACRDIGCFTTLAPVASRMGSTGSPFRLSMPPTTVPTSCNRRKAENSAMLCAR